MGKVIGSETTYVGDRSDLRDCGVRIECIVKNGARGGDVRRWFLHDDASVWREPVTQFDAVVVRLTGTLECIQVPALDVAFFRYLLQPEDISQEVHFEEPVLVEAKWAANASGMALDKFINDALAARLRGLGLLRAPARIESKGAAE